MDMSALDTTPRLMLTIPEAARHLSVGRTTVYALVKSGDLASITVGRLRRIPIGSLESLVASLPAAPCGAEALE